MTLKRKLIEHDIPLAEISEASAREKSIRHGHPSTLHIWWARRPLASSRATAFAALIDDPGEEHPQERAELQELLKQITPWEAVKNGNSAAVKEARRRVLEQYGRPPGQRRGFERPQMEQMILQYVEAHGKITRREVVELCRVTPNQASYLLRTLVDRSELELIGKGRSAHYVKSET